MQTLFTRALAVLTLDLDEGIRLNARLEVSQTKIRPAKERPPCVKTLELARPGLTLPIAELEKVLRAPDKNSATDLPQHSPRSWALGSCARWTRTERGSGPTQGLTVKLR